MRWTVMITLSASVAAACTDGNSTPPKAFPIEAERTCAPAADACSAPAAESAGVTASYRKDFFLSYDKYPEADIPDPVNGGRVQIAAVAATTGTVTAIEINGEDSDALTDRLWLHWIHVWPQELVAGEPFWVTFHSHEEIFDQRASMPITVRTAAGPALDGTFPIQTSQLKLTYVTTADDHQQVIVHVENLDDRPHRLTRLLVNDRDVTDVACVSSRTLQPDEVAMWTIPMCAPLSLGSAWTVVAEFEDAPPAVGVGRVVPEHFPVHTWPQSVDCPFPGGNEANLQTHLDAGFDTIFAARSQYSFEGVCEVETSTIIAASQARDDLWLMVERHAELPDNPQRIIRLIGDEADQVIEDRPLGKARLSQRYWAEHPEVPTYLGGSRHRNTAAFAGVTDFQGIDIYIGACAPHVTDLNAHPPVDSIFDFTEATRRNHMPLPTWVYSQGLSVVWNTDNKLFQPNAAEVLISTASVLAGGAKGLMYFQSNLEMARAFPQTWEAISQINADVRVVRQWLREGDPLVAATRTDAPAIVRAIRARDAIVLVVINTLAEKEASDLGCFVELARDLLDPETSDPETLASSHEWIMAPQTMAFEVDLPEDARATGLYEVDGGELRASDLPTAAVGRTLSVSGVALDHQRPTRIFVLPATAAALSR